MVHVTSARRRCGGVADVVGIVSTIVGALAALLLVCSSPAGAAGAGDGDPPVLTPTEDGEVFVVPRGDTDDAHATDQADAIEDEPTSAAGDDLGWAEISGLGLLAAVSLALTGVSTTTLWWMLHAWRSPESLTATGFGGHSGEPTHTFSLVVPARHEEEVLGHTLDRLATVDYPYVEIIAVVGHDDPGTHGVALAAALRHPERVSVVVDHNVPKNKPKALNTALPVCRGDVVGVFDAEDEVHPQLLRHVDARLVETGATVVQGGVQLMDVGSSWFAVRNVLEYYFWFRSRLHFHAQQRFIPLGGNTVFVRTDVLRNANGWDESCLAEDCELGVRLSVEHATVVVAYEPDLVTREETPDTVRALVKQRTRWNQGFLQVLRKGIWRSLPSRRQRLLARYTLGMPFLQAFTGVMIPISVWLMLAAKVPPPIALLSFLPVVPTLVTLFVELAGLEEFGHTYDIPIRNRDRLRLLLGTIPYQVLLAGAALRAVARELRGDASWEKTTHHGTHRVDDERPVPTAGAGR